MSEIPRWSIVVCTRRRPVPLGRCLESILALEHPSYEILVVDNTDGDGAVEGLARQAGARYVTVPVAGLSSARNVGGRLASGNLVAFTDDDAVVEPGWLDRLEEGFHDDAVAACTGRVVLAPPDAPGPMAYAAIGGEDIGPTPFTLSATNRYWFEITNFGGLGVGPNMAFRRSLFDAGWGFPHHLGPPNAITGEEHFAFFTVLQDGHSIAYLPKAVVHHYCVRTRAETERRRIRILQGMAAYVLMLLIEQSGYRLRTLRYVAGSLRSSRRSWRGGTAIQAFGTRPETIRAATAGVGLYWRNWMVDRRALKRPRNSSRARPREHRPNGSAQTLSSDRKEALSFEG